MQNNSLFGGAVNKSVGFGQGVATNQSQASNSQRPTTQGIFGRSTSPSTGGFGAGVSFQTGFQGFGSAGGSQGLKPQGSFFGQQANTLNLQQQKKKPHLNNKGKGKTSDPKPVPNQQQSFTQIPSQRSFGGSQTDAGSKKPQSQQAFGQGVNQVAQLSGGFGTGAGRQAKSKQSLITGQQPISFGQGVAMPQAQLQRKPSSERSSIKHVQEQGGWPMPSQPTTGGFGQIPKFGSSLTTQAQDQKNPIIKSTSPLPSFGFGALKQPQTDFGSGAAQEEHKRNQGQNQALSKPAPKMQKQDNPGTVSHSSFKPDRKPLLHATGPPNHQQNKKPCNNFFTTGTCTFGDRCRFSHEGNFENFESVMADPDMQQKMALMIQAAAQSRQLGSQDTGGKKVCHFFQEGRCWKKDQCPFYHGTPGAEGQQKQTLQQSRMQNPAKDQKYKQGISAQQMLDQDNVADDSLPQRFLRKNSTKLETKKTVEANMKAQFEQLKQRKHTKPPQTLQEEPGIDSALEPEEFKQPASQSQKKTLVLNKQRTERVASPEHEVEEQKKAKNSQHRQWVSTNRTHSGAKASESYYSQHPIDPGLQEVTALHYRIVLNKLAQSQEAKKNEDKAQCVGMCSSNEIHARSEVEIGAMSNFETRPDGSLFQQHAVSRFGRRAAGKISDVKDVRPPVILYHTFSYLRDCVVDQDRIPKGQSYFKYLNGSDGKQDFDQIYSFLRDRFRQITQELIMNAQPCDIYDVRTTEELVRFLIISYHDCFQGKVFDLVQNTERLTHNLGRLQESYDMAEQMLKAGQLEAKICQNILRNKAEMLSYFLIVTSMSPLDNLRHVCDIKWTQYTSDEKAMIVEALRIQQVIRNSNFVEYFRTLRRPSTNYFFACVMLTHIERMRLEAVCTLHRGFAVQKIPLQMVKTKLNLPSEADAESLIHACGFYYDESIKRYKRVTEKEEWLQTWKKWRQTGPLVEHDALRGVIRRSRLIKIGIAAFETQEADLGKENQLDDIEKILGMATEDASVASQQKRQEIQAKKKADIDHQLQLAEIKRQKDEELRRKQAEELKIQQEEEKVRNEAEKKRLAEIKEEEDRLL